MPRRIDPGTIVIGPGQTVRSTAGVADSPALLEHLTASAGAHPATAIDIDDVPPVVFDGTTVESALDELSALIPPQAPGVGEVSPSLGLLTVPDWGALKLDASSLVDNDVLITSDFSADEIYPYYWRAPALADDGPPEFPVDGEDPETDAKFNINSLSYEGAGVGTSVAGGFTRTFFGTPEMVVTHRLVPHVSSPANEPVVVSGVLAPADRGVLALVRWNNGLSLGPSNSAADLQDRVVAALLLDGGANDTSGSCALPGSGGLAFYGVAGNPYTFPGKAAGQYNLREIHTATRYDLSGPLPPPFDVADNAAGQVRLGTDPAAGAALVFPDGIPILGGTSVARGGGNDNNFFRYRLPYLEDYSLDTGLRYTPASERDRYFDLPTVSEPSPLTSAGNYTDFSKDYWAFQVARFRHQFELSADDAGTYALIHFVSEEKFEAFARDGIAPTSDDVYSVFLPDMLNGEDIDNIGTAALEAADSYHVIRSATFRDASGASDVTVSANTWDYTRVPSTTTQVSGIQYFVPRVFSTDAPAFQITSMDLLYEDSTGAALGTSGVFENTYFTHDADTAPFGDERDRVENRNPLFLGVTPFSGSSPGGIPSLEWDAPTTLTGNSVIRNARIEFNIYGMDSPSSPWADPQAPEPTDDGGLNFNVGEVINFTGDFDEPRFSTDATLRAFLRRPLRNSVTFNAIETELVPVDGNTILFHSSNHTLAGGGAQYGNFADTTTPYPGVSIPFSSTLTARKDVEERFLDEIYRYVADFSDGGSAGPAPVPPATTPTDLARLAGPGLPGGASEVRIPVRPYNEGLEDEWLRVSYFGLNRNQLNLASDPLVTGEAQVAGLPDRNPPLEDGTNTPMPSTGRLTYPATDFSTGHRPSQVDGDIAAPQYDYSGASGDREYVRCFDVGFSRLAFESRVGETEFILRLQGITFEDIKFAGIGPGSLGMAVLVKVPGLTTWMDAGRPDGEGPSKQDPVLDGAGCLVVDAEETLDGIDDGGIVFTQVRLNVGPDAAFFLNNQGEIPVLVKVIIKDSVMGRSLNFEQLGPDASNNRVRALTSILVVRESDAFGTTAFIDRRFDSGFEDIEALDTGGIVVYET